MRFSILSPNITPKWIWYVLVPFAALLGGLAVAYAILRLKDNSNYYFSLQLTYSHILVKMIYLYLFSVSFYFRKEIIKSLRTFFNEPVSVYSIAIFRIGFFGFIIGLYWYQFQNAAILEIADFKVEPLPYTSWYLPLLSFNFSFYQTAYYLGIGVALMSCFGIGYRYIAWLNIIFSFYLIGLPMFLGKLFFMQLWFWGSCFLAFAPASDVLSIDALLFFKGEKKDSQFHPKYGYAIKFIWLHLGIIYFFSAMGKLNDTGIAWAIGDNMINQMQIEWLTNYYAIPSFRLDHYPIVAQLGGLYIMYIELIFIFLLFNKKTQWVALFGGLSVHWGATYFLHLSMGDMQFMYLSFLVVLLIPYKGNYPIFPTVNKWNKLPLKIGIVFFIINSLCGFFEINSWPFSAYPKHSSYVSSTFKRIEFSLPSLDRFALDSIAQKNNFRKDNYYSLSDNAIVAMQNNDTVSLYKNLTILWQNWQINNPELARAAKPEVYILETPIDPKKKYEIISQRKIAF